MNSSTLASSVAIWISPSASRSRSVREDKWLVRYTRLQSIWWAKISPSPSSASDPDRQQTRSGPPPRSAKYLVRVASPTSCYTRGSIFWRSVSIAASAAYHCWCPVQSASRLTRVVSWMGKRCRSVRKIGPIACYNSIWYPRGRRARLISIHSFVH